MTPIDPYDFSQNFVTILVMWSKKKRSEGWGSKSSDAGHEMFGKKFK